MKRLLIVDDSKLMQGMVAACLRALGEVVFEFASTGIEAIERLTLSDFDSRETVRASGDPRRGAPATRRPGS